MYLCSVWLSGSHFAFRIKFKLVSLVAEVLHILALNVLQLISQHSPHVTSLRQQPAGPDWSPLTWVPLHRLFPPLRCLRFSPLSFCSANSYSPLQGSGHAFHYLGSFFYQKLVLVPPSCWLLSLPRHPIQLCKTLTEPYSPRCARSLAYPQGKHTVNAFEQVSLIVELMTFHVKNDNSHKLRFSLFFFFY